MSQRVIACQVVGEYVTGDGVVIGAVGAHGSALIELDFTADSSGLWEGTTKTVTFTDALGANPVNVLLTADLLADGQTNVYQVPVPQAAMAVAGMMGITVTGVIVSGEIETVRVATELSRFRVLANHLHIWDEEDIPATAVEQLQAEITDIDAALGSHEADAVRHITAAERAAWNAKQNELTFDSAPTSRSANPVYSDGIYLALESKQNTLTFDSTPTAGSTNPVTSGGVKTALDGKLDVVSIAAGTGRCCVIEGAVSTSDGYYSDELNETSGECAHAEGYSTKAVSFAHAEGFQSDAEGSASHAEGTDTTASGNSSHAEGNGTVAGAKYSHAEGSQTQSIGQNAHAEGEQTVAFGKSSHAEGVGTYASHLAQHVFGSYNADDPSSAESTFRGTYVEIVGNGANSISKSNARTLDWNGNEVLAGKLTLGVGPVNNMDAATKEYVDGRGGVSAFNGRTGNVMPQSGDYTAAQVGALPASTVIPSKTSDLTNDAGFITEEQLPVPVNHADSNPTYGVGSWSSYGHVKLSDSTSGTSGMADGVAATPSAVKAAYDLAASRQSALTFDPTPTANSTNPVTSGGIKTYVDSLYPIVPTAPTTDGVYTLKCEVVGGDAMLSWVRAT